MRLQASAKVPLADPERGFGMGTWDVGGGLALSKHLGGPFVFVGICRLVHRALTVCKMTSRLPSVSVIS